MLPGSRRVKYWLGRFNIVRVVLAACLNVTFLCASGQDAPNLIIILVDDLGYGDVGFNGCKDIPTPNIDRIAHEGVIFSDGYVSYPVCGPSRAGLITGRYQDRFGFSRNPLFAPYDSTMGLPLSEQTLANVLRQVDYRSVALGKWHLGAHPTQWPLQRGFDDFYGFLTGAHRYFPEELNVPDEHAVTSHANARYTKLLRNEERVEETEYLTDAFSREAVAYIEEYQNQPFFMYLAYNAPHTPLQATEKYLKRFDHIEDEKRKTYAAMVSAVDDGVGLILEKLAELSIDENTMLVFLSDNGGPQSNASSNGVLKGWKGSVYEGGLRVPFAMRWPRMIKPGKVYNQPISSLDIFATIAARSKDSIELANPIDGVDLLPYLQGTKRGAPHPYLFWRKFDQQFDAVRGGDFKILNENGEEELYNVADDVSETSLIHDTTLSNTMMQEYELWQSQLEAPRFLGLSQIKEYGQSKPDWFNKPLDWDARFNPDTIKKMAFDGLNGLPWEEVFKDAGTDDWETLWTLDGIKAQVINGEQGMDFFAGPNRKENASHAVLWTKDVFSGDIRIDYEYTRLDSATEAVNILYLLATGSGQPGFAEDISQWADQRKIPKMRYYFNHMNLLHISYAAYGIDNVDSSDDYIRARRYMPDEGNGLKNTDLDPDYFNTGLFETGVAHQITVIKHGQDLFMRIQNSDQTFICQWDTSQFPAVTSGRIGLRHMWTRAARYKDFSVSILD